tara:strand:- start:863 stop:1258 length:396 start_codon:yes stop_codon:yes gene_type:complete
MENDIKKITTEEKETLNPRMLKCVNCGVPAELYVNNKRVCSDTVCVNVYRHEKYDNNLRWQINDAANDLSRCVTAYHELPRRPFSYEAKRKCDEWDEREKRLATAITNAKRSLNELIEERTKRYQEYLQKE